MNDTPHIKRFEEWTQSLDPFAGLEVVEMLDDLAEHIERLEKRLIGLEDAYHQHLFAFHGSEPTDTHA